MFFRWGIRGAQIETWLRDAEIMSGVKWRVHHEQKPLGTGGGVRACLDLCAGDILVANADSLLLFPLPQLLNGFKDTSLNGALIGVPMPDCSRYGALQFNAGGLLTGFREKQPGEGEINSGLYVFRKAVIAPFPENTPLSMEYDIIPKLIIERKRLKVFHAEKNTPFIDIGTPESLTQADQFIRRYLI